MVVQELSLLEYEVLAFPPTAIAASCLVMALARYAQVAAAQQLQPTATALAQAAASQQLQVCAHWLLLGSLPAEQLSRGCGPLLVDCAAGGAALEAKRMLSQLKDWQDRGRDPSQMAGDAWPARPAQCVLQPQHTCCQCEVKCQPTLRPTPASPDAPTPEPFSLTLTPPPLTLPARPAAACRSMQRLCSSCCS